MASNTTQPVASQELTGFSVVSAVCLSVVGFVNVLCYVVANKQWKRLRAPATEKWILFWCYYDAFTHICMVRKQDICVFVSYTSPFRLRIAGRSIRWDFVDWNSGCIEKPSCCRLYDLFTVQACSCLLCNGFSSQGKSMETPIHDGYIPIPPLLRLKSSLWLLMEDSHCYWPTR